MKTYKPKPTDTSKIALPEELEELVEILACHVHDIWAEERIRQGWQYGPERDDHKKLHPCLVPYDELPDEEKIFDRSTALETIKVILVLGYKIDKSTDLPV